VNSRDRDDNRDDRVREKRSWREIDAMRDGSRRPEDRAPRGRAAQERADAASKQYRKQLAGMFPSDRGGAEGKRLAKAMRDAHGSPGLADACREFRDAVGPPCEVSHILFFLDCGDRDLILGGLEALRTLLEAESTALTAGLRSQLRMLADDRDHTVADLAEEILED
jgi:hypothetical protein